jgi:hypothetical protein
MNVSLTTSLLQFSRNHDDKDMVDIKNGNDQILATLPISKANKLIDKLNRELDDFNVVPTNITYIEQHIIARVQEEYIIKKKYKSNHSTITYT